MEAILSLLIPVTFVLMLVLERVFPGRPLPKVRFWALKGGVCFVLCAALAGAVPAVLAIVLQKHAPIHLGSLPTAVAAVLGFLVGDLVLYGVHRVMHNVPFIWRWAHQMHHSAERVDMLGANFIHPIDLVLQVSAGAIPALLLGLSPDASALAGYIGFLWGMFPHLNVRTPQWIGRFVQRPEAHAVHHARGIHAYNYANFPLWDIAFGTFRSPATFTEPAGFWNGASRKLGAMLIGRDVSEPPAKEDQVTIAASDANPRCAPSYDAAQGLQDVK
jgi:sterol desaturase/sphingolipid hydroxylase (fatty acid hydroxylase superfamily)